MNGAYKFYFKIVDYHSQYHAWMNNCFYALIFYRTFLSLLPVYSYRNDSIGSFSEARFAGE